MRVTHRAVTPGDEPFLHTLITATLTEELCAWAWPEAMRGQLLELQYRVRRQGVESTYPDSERRLILIDGQPAGWLVVARTAEEIHLVDVAILQQFRGTGAGTALIRELLEESRRTGVPVRLCVNVTNRAGRLYERLGFRRTGGNEVQHFMEWSPAGAGDPVRR